MELGPISTSVLFDILFFMEVLTVVDAGVCDIKNPTSFYETFTTMYEESQTHRDKKTVKQAIGSAMLLAVGWSTKFTAVHEAAKTLKQHVPG